VRGRGNFDCATLPPSLIPLPVEAAKSDSPEMASVPSRGRAGAGQPGWGCLRSVLENRPRTYRMKRGDACPVQELIRREHACGGGAFFSRRCSSASPRPPPTRRTRRGDFYGDPLPPRAVARLGTPEPPLTRSTGAARCCPGMACRRFPGVGVVSCRIASEVDSVVVSC
jgi:hypothetical protein